MSFTEGSVFIEVDLKTPGVTSVQTRSSRAGEIAHAINTQPVSSPLPETLISSLYALCPQAHLGAFRAACAAAQGQPTQITISAQKILREMLAEHLRFLTFDAMNAVGLKSDPDIRKLSTLRAMMSEELSRDKPDFERIDESIESLIEHFVTGYPLSRFEALSSLPDFEAWLVHSSTSTARLFAQLWEEVPCRTTLDVPYLPAALTPEDVEKWFSKDASVAFDPAAPTCYGVAHQTGSIVKTQDSPLIHEIVEQYRCHVRQSFAARLIDFIESFKSRNDPKTLANILKVGNTAPGVGTSLALCARGTLIHRIQIVDGCYASVTIAAPTEWNFASGSIAQRMLEAIEYVSREQYLREASWVLSAVDPCIPTQFQFLTPEQTL